jgi:hypothetical protein
MTIEESAIVDRCCAALTAARTLKTIDACLDLAWKLLPWDAAKANTVVIQAVSRRRLELRGGHVPCND